MSMNRNRLIVDTDGGVDDAQALVMLIGNGWVPAAITTVFGNVSLQSATDNILAILATLKASVPVYRGADRPLIGDAIDAKYVHGDDGLGGAPRPERQDEPQAMHAVDFLRTELAQATRTEPVDLLMIGPLTNLALALRLDPDCAKGIGTLYIMGGTVKGRGNVTPAAEFNFYADPESASIVLSAGIATVLVPWESCTEHMMTGTELDDAFAGLPTIGAPGFSLALSQHLRRNAQSRGRGDVMLFVDPLASAVMLDPSMIETATDAAIEIELSAGPARGMSIIDPAGRIRASNVRIVESVDNRKLAELFRRSIAYAP
ncbi:nucleoside hydrolase [Rhizobium alvei]|uniref:Nucleoside hydrolase n=1 Tax=Rhizobium alvei TaxID=1132659 RepID=A0ABT8YT56_9HYPH|nr:nucleoside hydrolase [Rhizobium alvei]MDO6966400.1 nucleoside hydrolase [Rhizobium alvei]